MAPCSPFPPSFDPPPSLCLALHRHTWSGRTLAKHDYREFVANLIIASFWLSKLQSPHLFYENKYLHMFINAAALHMASNAYAERVCPTVNIVLEHHYYIMNCYMPWLFSYHNSRHLPLAHSNGCARQFRESRGS